MNKFVSVIRSSAILSVVIAIFLTYHVISHKYPLTHTCISVPNNIDCDVQCMWAGAAGGGIMKNLPCTQYYVEKYGEFGSEIVPYSEYGLLWYQIFAIEYCAVFIICLLVRAILC